MGQTVGKKIINRIKNFFKTPEVRVDLKKLCGERTKQVNKRRLFIASMVVLVIELFLIITFSIDYFRGNSDVLPNLILNSCFFGIVLLVIVLIKLTNSTRIYQIILYIFIFCAVIYGITLGFIDSTLKGEADIASYIMAMLIVASILVVKPPVFFFLQLMLLGIFLYLYVSSDAFSLRITDITNIVFSNIMAAFIVFYNHRSNFKNTINAILIEIKSEKYKQESLIDPLTGLYNRRSFNDYFDIEWKRAIRANCRLGLFMIDIDYFKNYNDEYGHLMGDDVLVKVANALKGIFKRSGDYIARYGGEEFAILVTNYNHLHESIIASKILQTIKDLGITHKGTGLEQKILTVSIGVSSIVPTKNDTLLNFINQADIALYEAKRAGKNTYISAEQSAGFY